MAKTKNETEEVEKVKEEMSETSETTEATAATNIKKMVRGMKGKLDECKKATIKIPVDKMNPKDTTVLVQINGYTYTIKRGEEVTVPDVVKKLLERGGYI